MLTVGVTGATGFIGSSLVQKHLEAGHTVRCLTRRPPLLPPTVDPIEGDIANPGESLDRFCEGLDVLYHCAGEVNDEHRMQCVNVGGVRALLHAAGGRIGKWVQLSSAGVYGRPRVGVISEDSALAPLTTYERTKATADELVLAAAQRQQIPSCAILRPSIVFGSAMPNHSIRQMVRMIRRRLFFFIGRRGASANYVHVSNVADALMLCATSPGAARRVYNLSDWCTVEEFAGAIADALGQPPPRLRLPEPVVRRAVRVTAPLGVIPLTESRVDALVSRARYSSERIQQELGFCFKVSIREGLARMVASMEAA